LGVLSMGKSNVSVGLDIETNTFRVVQLKSTSGAPMLTNYSSIRVPAGAVVEDEVVDIDVVGQTLSQLWKQAGISEKKVVIGIANQKVVVRLIPLPYMERSELSSAIQYQAEDFIPIPVEEAILDFDIVGEFTTEENERMMEVLLVAAQKDMITNVMTALEKAGLRPRIIDVSSLALARALLNIQSVVPESDDEAVALVNIASGITNIVLVEKGTPRFTRVSVLAGNSFTQRIADTLNVSFDEAEELKLKYGLPPIGEVQEQALEVDDPEKAKIVQDVLMKELGKFIGELRRSIDYYLTQRPGVKSVQSVILSGNGVKVGNLVAHIEQGLQLKVEIGNPLKKVKIGPKLSEDTIKSDEYGMALSLGLGLRGLEE